MLNMATVALVAQENKSMHDNSAIHTSFIYYMIFFYTNQFMRLQCYYSHGASSINPYCHLTEVVYFIMY